VAGADATSPVRGRYARGMSHASDARPTSRRPLLAGAFGVSVSAVGFGLVYGLAARQAGFSVVEVVAMSTLVLAGGAQFAAVGFVAAGVPWTAIVGFTALLNARHLLYAAALAPWLQHRRRRDRAAMAHLLTDEAFALSLPWFRRIGGADVRGYLTAAGALSLAWIVASAVGALGGGFITEPGRLGLDVIFPAAMAGLAVGLIETRREVVAAALGAIVALAVAVSVEPSVGIVVGGIAGPLLALAVPHGTGIDAPRPGLRRSADPRRRRAPR
jgi:4-azaleucine resistance transporter AzlC